MQTLLGPHEGLVGQQGAPIEPHATQVLPAQTFDPAQVPSQQGCPVAPQATQRRLEASQNAPLPHRDPAQHGWFAPPHATQVPDSQTAPAEQVSPAQQG